MYNTKNDNKKQKKFNPNRNILRFTYVNTPNFKSLNPRNFF